LSLGISSKPGKTACVARPITCRISPSGGAVVISTDQHVGRFLPLVRKQARSVDTVAMVTPGSSWPAFLQGGLVTDPRNPPVPDVRVEAILLEVKGLVDYTRTGDILEQHLSEEVAEAFNFMGAYFPQVLRHDQSRLLENTIELNEILEPGEDIGTISDQELAERKAKRVDDLKRRSTSGRSWGRPGFFPSAR
jgi:hypothetical protein